MNAATNTIRQDIMKHEAIVSRIRKLLSLSNSANRHEAMAAAAKAQELLSRYNLELEAVALDENTGKASFSRSKTRQRLEKWAFRLAHDTAWAFDCEYYHDTARGETVFVGVGADPEVCGWMYGYLYKRLLRLSSERMASPACKRLRSNVSKKLARDSFLFGITAKIAHRLMQQKEVTPVTSSGALVLAKKNIISAAMPPGLNTRGIKPAKIREQDFASGLRAGADVPLSTPVNNTNPSQLALG